MATVLSQISSFLRVWPIPSHNLLEQLLKLDGRNAAYYVLHSVQWYNGTVYSVHFHWDLKKCFNPCQILFWRKENNLLNQTIVKNYLTIHEICMYSMKLQCCTVYSVQASVFKTAFHYDMRNFCQSGWVSPLSIWGNLWESSPVGGGWK